MRQTPSQSRERAVGPWIVRVLFIILGVAGMAAPAAAQQQEEQPYRVDLIDVTRDRDDSRQIASTLRDLLSRASRLSYREGAFRQAAQERGLTRAKLRSGDGRDANREAIGESMRAANLDMMLLIDAYSNGRKLQLLVIGPEGDALYESKEQLSRRARISQKEATNRLREVLKAAVPKINEWREAEAERKRQAEAERRREAERSENIDVNIVDAFDEDADAGVSDSSEVDGPRGPLPSHVTAGAGAFLGFRQLQFNSPTVIIDQVTPLLGVAAGLNVAKGIMRDRLQLGLDVDFAYAPFTNDYTGLDGSSQELASTFLRASGIARLAWAPASILYIAAIGGAETLSITIEPNPTYTGHRYIWGRIGGEIGLLPAKGFRIFGQGAALPALEAVTSGDAYGLSEGATGFDVGGGFDIELAESTSLRAHYRLTDIDLNYTPPEGQSGERSSDDRLHSGMVAVTYAF